MHPYENLSCYFVVFSKCYNGQHVISSCNVDANSLEKVMRIYKSFLWKK